MFLSLKNFLQRKKAVLFSILFLVFLIFLPLVKGQFLTYQDDLLITQNSAVNNLDFVHFKEIFQHRINGNYMPLTMLSYSLEKTLFGLTNPN